MGWASVEPAPLSVAGLTLEPEEVPVDPPPPALAELLLELLLRHAAKASAAANDTAPPPRRVVRTWFLLRFQFESWRVSVAGRPFVLMSCEPPVVTCRSAARRYPSPKWVWMNDQPGSAASSLTRSLRT